MKSCPSITSFPPMAKETGGSTAGSTSTTTEAQIRNPSRYEMLVKLRGFGSDVDLARNANKPHSNGNNNNSNNSNFYKNNNFYNNNNNYATIFVDTTKQVRDWCRSLLYSNNGFYRQVASLLVAPLCILAPSLEYQIYLMIIFHTNFKTRLFHHICIPIVVFFMMAVCAGIPFHKNYARDGFVGLLNNYGTLACLALLVGFALLTYKHRTYLAGLLCIPLVLTMWILSYLSWFIWEPFTSLWSLFSLSWWNPVLWMVVAVTTQSWSHYFEPNLPPRANKTEDWINRAEFIKTNGLPRSGYVLMWCALVGIFDEWLASPKLLYVIVVQYMAWYLGYWEPQYEAIAKWSNMAMQSGNAHIDFIGIGGSRPPHPDAEPLFNSPVALIVKSFYYFWPWL